MERLGTKVKVCKYPDKTRTPVNILKATWLMIFGFHTFIINSVPDLETFTAHGKHNRHRFFHQRLSPTLLAFEKQKGKAENKTCIYSRFWLTGGKNIGRRHRHLYWPSTKGIKRWELSHHSQDICVDVDEQPQEQSAMWPSDLLPGIPFLNRCYSEWFIWEGNCLRIRDSKKKRQTPHVVTWKAGQVCCIMGHCLMQELGCFLIILNGTKNC